MTKWYLQRVIDSFTKDFPKPDAERAREIILENAEELTDPERIRQQLRFRDASYSHRILYRYVLEVLLNDHDHTASEEEIVTAVLEAEEAVLSEAEEGESLQYEDEHGVDILRTVLSVAVEDEQISEDEQRLIEKLRIRLGLQSKTSEILLAQLDHFPQAGNKVHTPSDTGDALKELQRRGVLFYCNRLEGGLFLIPNEIVPGVKDALGFELGAEAWRKLLDHLKYGQLQTVLEAKGLPKSGRKAQLIERVVQAGVQPSEALDELRSEELYELLGSLPGATVSGSKHEKISRLIDYFANLVIKDLGDEVPEEEVYYEYLVELAERDRENLLANDVIKKDREMDRAFEKGTRYLFREKLGLEPLEPAGSDHADGILELDSTSELFMWDTKSKEGVYTFPRSHLRQFKRYIRDSMRRVSCFLVIVPEVGEGVEEQAARLKVESRSDTDVSVVASEDLKWLAETWEDQTQGARFDLEVFNITGVLNRSTLEKRMKLFL